MSGRVVVITGASGGIGAALAANLGARGDLLALGARRMPELERVASSAGESAIAIATDVTVRSDVARLRDEALSKFGRIDVWVNNAGRGINKGVMELTDGDVDAMMAVNLKSALYGMQAVIPHFQKNGKGHLINVSSFLGRVPIASNRSAYNAAKHALNALTANLRMDLAKTHPGISVSTVMPGVVGTDFSKNALYGGASQFQSGAVLVQSPAEVAEKIAELIDSPQAELYTSPESAKLVSAYFADVAAFEANMAQRR